MQSQTDTEQADLSRERQGLRTDPDGELAARTEINGRRSVERELAGLSSAAHIGRVNTATALVVLVLRGALAMGFTALVGRLFGTMVQQAVCCLPAMSSDQRPMFSASAGSGRR